MTPYFLGIDAGSSLTKAAVFDANGNQFGMGVRRIQLRRPHPGWSEIDPAEAWSAVSAAIHAALDDARIASTDIAAVGLSAAMVGAWLVDGDGNALRPGIVWEDSRAQDLLDERAAAVPDFYRRIFRSNGCVLQQGCTLPLLAWLRKHEPDILDRAAHVFSYKDFLRLKLTGQVAADRTEAAVAPGNASLRGRSVEMLDLFEIADLAYKLPAAAESETLAGFVTAESAAITGLAEGTPVAIGAGDVPATVIGASALEAGTALAVLGTTCMVGIVSDQPVFTPPDIGLLFTLPGEAWFRAMVNVAGTLNLDWAIGTLLPDIAAEPDLYIRMEAMIAALPIGCDGVVYLPYLSESGIIAPVVDHEARAGFHGLAPRHRRPHMIRAVYEGVALALRDLYQDLEGTTGTILLTGGGARSQMWTQMIADALGATVLVPAGTEFGARGAALLAATAVGRFRSVRQASISTRQIQRRHEADHTTKPAWDRAFINYRARRDSILRR
ncbi:FGGY-family carbohydrate kinase [Mesorhizobium sp. ES1-1]|uniref:FGGY-family carbohydrate kinase n=1 Tax=Mesorhizobium sp. ES1-1 TaxID=2876629 RepID=UPI001CCA32AD|nr:FGGY-family carbohydrate kinase [Mesorhizobium sp. ES1-1]MBZ9674122.1 carbohydrate kinase [Mesorhizobium sp. ES1-1]